MNLTTKTQADTSLPSPANIIGTVRSLSSKGNIEQMQTRCLPVQAKLSVGAADDILEHEADAMANRVMRMPEPNFIQRKCAHCEEEEKIQQKPAISFVQLKCADCEEKEKEKIQQKPLASFIQRKESLTGSVASESLSNQLQSARGNGTGMDASTRSFMENRFGASFGKVRIHTGNESVQMNRELHARAFTVGNDIYFNEREYEPHSDSGKYLLAHELTHTIQQTAPADPLQRKLFIQRTLAPVAISGIAEEIRAATEIWGTDEERIFINLQRLGRDPDNILALTGAYRIRYNESLVALLRDELSGSELQFALQLINIIDPGESSMIRGAAPVDAPGYTQVAARLHTAISGAGTNEEAIYSSLLPLNRDNAKLSLLQSAYSSLTHSDLLTDIRDDMSDEELSYALYLMNVPDNNEHTATTLEDAIRRNPVYSTLLAESHDRVERIIRMAATMPYGEGRGHRFYYLRYLNIALTTPFPGVQSGSTDYDCTSANETENRDEVESALQLERDHPSGISPRADEDIVAASTHMVEREGELQGARRPRYRVDYSDPANIRVFMKVKLNGVPAEVGRIRSLEDAIERAVSGTTRGYHLDISFVSHRGPDVFEFTVRFCEWANSGNWASGPFTLSHEVHHALNLPDRYDYIESHSVNRGMNVAARLLWFEEEMNKTVTNNPRSKMNTNQNPLLNDDVCSVALNRGPERDNCITARNRVYPELNPVNP